jgi:hypothetical protein
MLLFVHGHFRPDIEESEMLTYSYSEAQDARDAFSPDCDGGDEISLMTLIELHEQFVTYANAKAWLEDVYGFVPKLLGKDRSNFNVLYVEEQLEMLLEDEHYSK